MKQVNIPKSLAIPIWQKEETLHRLKTRKKKDFIPWAVAKK